MRGLGLEDAKAVVQDERELPHAVASQVGLMNSQHRAAGCAKGDEALCTAHRKAGG